MSKFAQLGLSSQLTKAVEKSGYDSPTPIQEKVIPLMLEGGDIVAIAQTGTGKTAAFVLPILERLKANQHKATPKHCSTLIIVPTRELAKQIDDNIEKYGAHIYHQRACVVGGVKYPKQIKRLNQGLDILVATPGRLEDHLKSGNLSLDHTETLILDEADQMLDMGFIHDIKKLLRLIPSKRQSLFFSATMPKSIMELSGQILKPNYKQVRIAVEKPTAERVSQCVYYVSKSEKPSLLIQLLKEELEGSVLVFGRTKHGCDKVVRILDKKGVSAAAIHGNKSQNARQKALKGFKEGKVRVLVATDIAARGIDISGLEHVVNYELPNISETYVHRIGRTGRAEASGSSISFCAADERGYLKDIEKLIKAKVPLIEEHPFTEGAAEEWSIPENRIPAKQGQRSQRGNRGPKQGGRNSRSGAPARGKRSSSRR